MTIRSYFDRITNGVKTVEGYDAKIASIRAELIDISARQNDIKQQIAAQWDKDTTTLQTEHAQLEAKKIAGAGLIDQLQTQRDQMADTQRRDAAVRAYNEALTAALTTVESMNQLDHAIAETHQRMVELLNQYYAGKGDHAGLANTLTQAADHAKKVGAQVDTSSEADARYGFTVESRDIRQAHGIY